MTLRKVIYWWGPVIAFAFLIFIISSLTISLEKDPFPLFDKVAHVSEYAIFAMLVFRALSGTLRRTDFLCIALLTVIISVGYGLGDELHQYFVPVRHADARDILADGLGAVVAVTAMFFKRKVLNR